MANRKGRKPKSREQKLKDALERTAPSLHILKLRRTFSFVKPEKGPDGRVGEIDQQICDTIGQLAAVGELDGHGYDPWEMVRIGRFWGGHIAKRYKGVGCKTGSFERRDRSEPSIATTPDDLLFERIDANLWEEGAVGYIATYERKALWSLVVDPLIGFGEAVPWAQLLIDDELFRRGRFAEHMTVGAVTENERALRNASIRALCTLVEGSLRPRWAA